MLLFSPQPRAIKDRSSKDPTRKQRRLLANSEIALPLISIPPRGLMLDFADSPNSYREAAGRNNRKKQQLAMGRNVDRSPKLMLAVNVESHWAC
jgi:hypothetical protein